MQASNIVEHDFKKSKSISNQQCVSCHEKSQYDWQQSDHSKAMAIAEKTTILADFNNKQVEHYGQKAHFFIKDDRYQVTMSYHDKADTYPIRYTFGHFPLQQYLVETEKGKLHVLPFAWDARKKVDGGQRWYHNYSHEEIRPEDRLHWRQPLQNWNGMCADCHSDGLVRNYEMKDNSFNTQFDNINVGCLSCHGDMTDHSKKAVKRNVSADTTSSKHPTGQWLRNLGDKTAHWQGEKRDNKFMDGCFACHSLRSPLNDGIKPNTPFLDQFSPQLLSSPNYHADGQIKEEVYVYGSFLQSKMYTAGVNCIDCHDKHTMKLKIEGNGLCLQCHGGEVYNVKEHHQHDNDSSGAQCVNCHMPDNRYMGVDDRRDHSFKIPRPDISQAFNTPNACTKCHDDKSNQWASESLVKWHGQPKPITTSKEYLMVLNSGQTVSIAQHLSIISDDKLDIISRATALQLLSYTTQTITADVLAPYLSHSEGLIRLSAANVATLLPLKDRVKYLSLLLQDQYKAIRVAAARGLVTSELLSTDKPLFDKAFKALINSNQINSWRGEGIANQGVLAIEMNNISAAEKSFINAIKVDPYFETGYINLADIYRAQQKPFQVASVLSKGIKNNPKSADLHYAYGLYFVRQKKIEKGITLFEQAMTLMPGNPQYAYTYILALDGAGQANQALAKLKTLIMNYQNNGQLKELGLYLSQKLNNRKDYDYFNSI
ncbi:multiheme c-type cytochrome [Pseudocolwellia sp. AS88]|uniref:multiheme c-type cytochrome n=1 Tax=Pseudocolwellia sp. AS88 TaxID=3063958 RepID=UPI00317000B9